MTLNDFKLIPDGHIFASGVLPNSPEGIFMNNDGGELRWVAKKGYGNDWAIYCHWSYKSVEWIEKYGNKIYIEKNIKLCVPCDKDVFKLYRY